MTPQFTYATYIRATPEKVWEALTKPELIKTYWFGRKKISDFQRGSTLISNSPEGELEWQGEILVSEPPRRLVYTFQPVDNDEPPSRVTFEIEMLGDEAMPQGYAVRVTITHDEFPTGSTVLPRIARGWPAIMSGLKSLLETGTSLGLWWKDQSTQ